MTIPRRALIHHDEDGSLLHSAYDCGLNPVRVGNDNPAHAYKALLVGLAGPDSDDDVPAQVDYLLGVHQPELVVWRNVRGILAHEGLLEARVAVLEKHGYAHRSKVLDTSRFGHERRQRMLWIIGTNVEGERPRLPRQEPPMGLQLGDRIATGILEANHLRRVI